MKNFLIFNNELLQVVCFKLQKEKTLSFPVIYNIESTNRCYMDCIMCPRSKMTRPLHNMDMTLFYKIIDQIDEEYNDFIWLDHFGDPMMNPNIIKMIGAAKAKGIKVGFSTNATSVTGEKAKNLIDSGLDLLHISLDGIDQDTYSYFRGRAANYDLAVKNIINFANLKVEMNSKYPFVTVAMIEMERNSNQSEQFKKQWSLNGIDKVMIKPFCTMGGTVNSNLSKGKAINKSARICFFPWSSMSIMSDGRVVPCCYDYDGLVTLGDINEESLISIWNGEKMKKLRKEHIIGDFSDNQMCKNCLERKNIINFKLMLKAFQHSKVDRWYM